jgi:transcriptional regulator with XRE-family HTH domain
MTSGDADTGAVIGSRIARARRELGLTQAALADQIGTPLGILDRYETGEADPEPVLERIAAVTGKSVQWFISGSDEESDTSGDLAPPIEQATSTVGGPPATESVAAEAASDTSGELAPPIEQATSTAGGPPVTESVAAEGQAERSSREEESPPTPAGESVVESGSQSLEQLLRKAVGYSPTQESRQREAALAERLEKAEAELDRYRQQEHSMAEALVLAKQTAAQVVEEAERRAAEIVGRAERDLKRLEAQRDRLEELTEGLQDDLSSFLVGILKRLEDDGSQTSLVDQGMVQSPEA